MRVKSLSIAVQQNKPVITHVARSQFRTPGIARAKPLPLSAMCRNQSRTPHSHQRPGTHPLLLEQLFGPRQPSHPQRCSSRSAQHLWKQHRSIGTHLGIHAPACRPRKRNGAIPGHRSRHRISHWLHSQPGRYTRPHQSRRHHLQRPVKPPQHHRRLPPVPRKNRHL